MDRLTPPRILIAGAIETELAPLRRRVEGMPVAVVCTGVGGKRAASVALDYVERCRPECVMLVGFAGGLDPEVKRGDVLRIERVRNEAGEEIGLPPSSPQARGLAGASLLTVDRVVATPREKERLFKAHLAVAVDMETFAVARALQPLGVELIALRAITDPADAALPAASSHWVTPDGTPRVVVPALWAATHPWRIGELLCLGRAAKLAAERLADEAEPIIRERLS